MDRPAESVRRGQSERVRILRELKERVAVITGAAGGIGRAFASRCALEGMKLVLADIDREALAVTAAEMRARGAPTVGVEADVATAADVERLATKTVDRFGTVHLLFNNAGVGIIGPRVWESTPKDVQWVVGVNLVGVVHVLRAFVPLMLDRAAEGHIVNVASGAGLAPAPGMGLYSASKAGVVALSEALHHDLALEGTSIKVTLVCPGPVQTRLVDAARNRPEALRNHPELEAARSARHGDQEEAMRALAAVAMRPALLAERVIEAVRSERFYVLTHPSVRRGLRRRLENMVEDRGPATPGPE
jgi:NAD(P)-dependent dehydrogenase (short-subunit alcohol dehydrogenase family)